MLLCCLRRNVDWLLIMNTSSSSPIKSKCCRLAATSVNNFPRFVTACIAQHSMEPYIAWESSASSAFNAPYTAGHCGACRRIWRLSDTDLCPCGETQTMSHIVESCPLTKLNGGLSRLHSADEDAVSWLTNYGKWHTNEKKKNAP